MAYSRFFLMIAVSTVLMLGLMYLNTYLIGHVFWSETRAYMAVVMGSVMAFVMLAFMLGMYNNRALNIAIFTGSLVVFVGALWLVRSQVTVQDRAYMRAMIPHHSIAIMTSSRAEITDPRVRTMADDIIFAQDKEIAEMRYLIADISANGEAAATAISPEAELKTAQEALTSEVVGKVDPEFLSEGDIAQVFADGTACSFAYSKTSPPVLVSNNEAALIKISGDLVRLDAGEDRFAAEPITVEVRDADNNDLFDLVISAGPNYAAGFRGHYNCTN